jgi:rRNA maturation endonuclease Nob1
MTNPLTRITEAIRREQRCPECQGPIPQREVFCDVCGHDLVAQSRASLRSFPGPIHA